MIFDKEKHDKLDCGEYADYDPKFNDSLFNSPWWGIVFCVAMVALYFLVAPMVGL